MSYLFTCDEVTIQDQNTTSNTVSGNLCISGSTSFFTASFAKLRQLINLQEGRRGHSRVRVCAAPAGIYIYMDTRHTYTSIGRPFALELYSFCLVFWNYVRCRRPSRAISNPKERGIVRIRTREDGGEGRRKLYRYRDILYDRAKAILKSPSHICPFHYCARDSGYVVSLWPPLQE